MPANTFDERTIADLALLTSLPQEGSLHKVPVREEPGNESLFAQLLASLPALQLSSRCEVHGKNCLIKLLVSFSAIAFPF
jgi:hypothetical protein